MMFVKAPRKVGAYLLGVVAVTLLSGHVAPSIDDNNRYLKLTPMRDGLRLAYTVFFGEIPGASERRGIDTNRDGRIDDAEARAFAQKIGGQVASALELEIGTTPHRVQWSVISPGMGSDRVAAGSFSIDLIAYVCLPGGPGTRHRVRLRDQFRIPRPGETEVRIEDSPGVTIHKAHVGGADDPTRNFRFVGPGGPLSDEGVELELTATAQAPLLPAGSCAGATTAPGRRAWWPLAAGAGVLATAGVLAVVARRRRRRVRAS